MHQKWTYAARMLSFLLVKILFLTFVCVSFLHTLSVHADIAIIVNPSNTNTLSLTKIRKIFMAKSKAFPDGSPAIPIQTNQDYMRRLFNRYVLKRTDSAINSYWARKLFSSQAKPPDILSSSYHIKIAIANNPHAIAYIDVNELDESVKAAMIIKTSP